MHITCRCLLVPNLPRFGHRLTEVVHTSMVSTIHLPNMTFLINNQISGFLLEYCFRQMAATCLTEQSHEFPNLNTS